METKVPFDLTFEIIQIFEIIREFLALSLSFDDGRII